MGHKSNQGKHAVKLENFDDVSDLSVAIIVVGHDFYRDNLKQILSKCKTPPILMDIPNLFINEYKQYENLIYWNL